MKPNILWKMLLPVRLSIEVIHFSHRRCHRIKRKSHRRMQISSMSIVCMFMTFWMSLFKHCVVEKRLKFRCRTKPLSLPKKKSIYKNQCLIRHFLVWRNIYVLIVHKCMFKICGKPPVQLMCPLLFLPT